MPFISKSKKPRYARLTPFSWVMILSTATVVLIVIVVLMTLSIRQSPCDVLVPSTSYLPDTAKSSFTSTNNVTTRITTSPTTDRNWIWEQLTDQEQVEAMRDAKPYLEAFVNILNKTKQDQWVSQNKCDIELFGSQWGTHQLCRRPQQQLLPEVLVGDCHFISFGISVDYSFDTDLAERWKCHGFAADPTIVHKSQLHDLVTFHNIAAKTLRPNQEARDAKRPWWVASVPTVKKFLGLEHIDVLKMDCEGCEYSLARDILVEEPDFFHHVDQFTFEVHLNKHWLDDLESLYYLAVLHKLLHEAGLEVMGTSIGGCGWEVEKYEHMQELKDMGYPNSRSKKVQGRRSCHEYLFARVGKADMKL